MTVPQFGVGRRPHVNPMGNDQRWSGLYRGVVVATNDPAMKGRIKALCPYPFGDVPLDWAEPSMPGGMFLPPQLGDGVWLMFEHGDVTQPVWMGIWYRNGTAPMQATYGTLQQDDEEASARPEDDATHKPFHDHNAGAYYSPHVRGWQTPSGHQILADDWVDANGEKHSAVIIRHRDGDKSIVLHEAGYVDVAAGSAYLRLQTDGTIALVAPNGLTVDAGSSDINVHAENVNVTADAQATVVSPSVQLGADSGTKRLMTEDDHTALQTVLNDVKAKFNAHTHTANGTPIIAAQQVASSSISDHMTTHTKAL